MVENGVMGDLATLAPLCPPLLWSSIATGHYADRHGVLDLVEPDPVTSGVRPVTRASLKSPQLWDLLDANGIRSQAIGWPVTHPARGKFAPTTAACVSDGFAHAIPDSIHPRSLESSIAPLRFRPQEWTGNELQLFVPELSRVDQDHDHRLARLAVLLAESVSVHAAATTLMESREWDFTAVWYGAIGRACAVFQAGTDEIYKDAVSGVYRFLDLFLGRLLRLAGPDAIVMLVSDRAASEPEWNASTGSTPRGMLCAAGAGIEPDELMFGAGLLDVAPTILGLFGFAPAAGMAGRAISEICATAPTRAPGNAPLFNPVFNPDPETAELFQNKLSQHELSENDLHELERLGYFDSVEPKLRPEAEAARRRREFHLARVLVSQGRAGEAIDLLEPLAGADAGNIEARLHLAHAYFISGRVAECRGICETLLAELPDSPLAPLARAHLAISSGNFEEAAAELASAGKANGLASSIDVSIGEAYLRIAKWDHAAAAFRSAVQVDPGMAAAHEGLAHALLASARHAEAAEAALDAIRVRYDRPQAHRVLGRALQALGRDSEAAGAFAASEMLGRGVPAA